MTAAQARSASDRDGRHIRRLGALATCAVLALSGCGDDGGGRPAATPEPAGGGGGTGLALEADASGALAYDPAALSAPAGTVTLTMSNPSPLSHDVSLEGDGVDEQGEVVGEGGTSTVSADLGPGTYAYYCSVPGHREGGMEGTLTVE